MALRRKGAAASNPLDYITLGEIGTLTTPVIFDHGSNAAAIRPVTTGPVWWTGTVLPTNALAADIWFDTTGAGSTLPAMPAGLTARWSALDLAALADGATVTTWADKVAALALTPTSAPQKKTGDFVRLDGVDDRMDVALAIAQPTTFIIVCRLPSVTTSQPILGSATSVHSISTSSASLLQLNAATAMSRSGAVAANEWMYLASVANGASSKVKKGSEAPTTGNAGTNGRATVRVGSNTAGSSFSQVDVKEILIWSRVLTDAELEDVRLILAAGHSITI